MFYFYLLISFLSCLSVIIYNFKDKLRSSPTVVILWIGIHLMLKTLYIRLIQLINQSVKKVGPDTYELTYAINNDLYKLRLKKKRGPNTILMVMNENQDIITDVIAPYYGASRDWHGLLTTPRYFNQKSLTFELSNGSEKTYIGDEIIDID